ncbi:MAG: glycosyltransferase family 4 protein [Gemmatimonadota bacterium]|nr:MAG: glycosyltransferase family 4 protein [Gemmatimonadota bacterium]
MKLVFINSARDWGGAEGWSAYFCTGMAERGHTVTFICHPRAELYHRLESDPSVELAPVRIRGELDPIRVYQLARLFRRNAPDVIVTYRTRDTKLAVVAQYLAGGFPLVQAHKAPYPLRDTPLYRFLWTRGVRAIATSSIRNREMLIRHATWLSQIPIRVIYNGVDIDHFRPRPESRAEVRAELGIPDSAFVVSYHGRIESRKQVDVMIDAVIAAASREAVHGIFLGSGPQLSELRERVERLAAPVTLTGFREDVPRLLGAADAAMHLSISDTLPHSVLEAMACGLPVVVSDEPSHREQIHHGEHGLVVPPGQPEAAAQAILELAHAPPRRAQMSAAARQRAVAEFNRLRMVEGYESFLEELLAEG